eukprot:403360379
MRSKQMKDISRIQEQQEINQSTIKENQHSNVQKQELKKEGKVTDQDLKLQDKNKIDDQGQRAPEWQFMMDENADYNSISKALRQCLRNQEKRDDQKYQRQLRELKYEQNASKILKQKEIFQLRRKFMQKTEKLLQAQELQSQMMKEQIQQEYEQLQKEQEEQEQWEKKERKNKSQSKSLQRFKHEKIKAKVEYNREAQIILQSYIARVDRISIKFFFSL